MGLGVVATEGPQMLSQRRSAFWPAVAPLTSRLQRRPFQLISVKVAAGALLAPPETTRTGVRHSCRLMPPW